MGSRYNQYGYHKDYHDSYGNDLRGGNDEYYVKYCNVCLKKAEHDVCTHVCVECLNEKCN